jgi:hypothetical protein
MFRVTTSKPYLDSIDRITNRVTWPKFLLFGQTKYDREKIVHGICHRLWIALIRFNLAAFGIKANVSLS